MNRRRRLALLVAGIMILAAVIAAALFVFGGSSDRTAAQQSISDATDQTDRLRTLSAAADATLGQLATGGLFGLAVGATAGALITYRHYDRKLT